MSNKSSPGTITSTEVRDMLRTAAQHLSSREEKALRMREGVGLDPTMPLPRRGQTHPDARVELLALELELVVARLPDDDRPRSTAVLPEPHARIVGGAARPVALRGCRP